MIKKLIRRKLRQNLLIDSLGAAINNSPCTPGTPDNLVVSGLVYDVADGTVTQVVAPAPLRAS